MAECSRGHDRCLIYFAPKKTDGRYGEGRSWSWSGLRNDRPSPYRRRALSWRNRCVDPGRMGRGSKQQRACLLAAPGFQASLKRSQQLIRVGARMFRL